MKKTLWIAAALLLACMLCAAAGAEEAGEAAGTAGDTPVYFRPEGAVYYHVVPDCRMASRGALSCSCTWAELAQEPYSSLLPCEICTIPLTRTEETPYAAFGDVGDAAVPRYDKYYCVAVYERDGAYYRAVARYDGTAKELLEATWGVKYDEDPEGYRAVHEKFTDYCKTLPVAYEEKITAVPLGQEELDAYVGKTLAEVYLDGFKRNYYFTPDGVETDVVAWKGFYEYRFATNMTEAEYREYGAKGELDRFKVTGVEIVGLYSNGANQLNYRADGTPVPPDGDN